MQNAAAKRRKYVLEVDLNTEYKPLKYKQFTINELLKHKASRFNGTIENKENVHDETILID